MMHINALRSACACRDAPYLFHRRQIEIRVARDRQVQQVSCSSGTQLQNGFAVYFEPGRASDRLLSPFPNRGQHADELIDPGSIVLGIAVPRHQRVDGPGAKVLLR